ncbi:MAG: hypothetical protein HYY49_06765 [Ignavibacteriales bacterium]|nr:hypothetical protein [Ignavibacteriales bacterium]
MQTLLVVLVAIFAYGIVILGFLRFFGFLSDRDAEIRKLLGTKRTKKKERDSLPKRRLRLARS